MKHLLLLGIVLSALHFSLSQIPDFCTMAADEGDGSGTEMRLYYSAATDQCVPFKYSGQGGNENRFINERDCMRNCSANVENVYPIEERNACLLTKTDGVCRGHFLRFYYSAAHEKCKKFFWTGCGGNGNRFTTPESCNAACDGVKREGRHLGDEEEEDDSDTNVGAIVAGVLGVVLVAVVATVIALAVKSKKKKSKKTKGKKERSEDPLRDQGIEME